MIKHLLKYQTILLFPVLFVCGATFGKQDSKELLRSLYETESMEEILKADLLNSWPNIFSNESPVYQQDSERQKLDYELLELMQERLQAYDDLKGKERSFASNVEAIRTYAALLSEIRNQQGYANYLLRDSVKRLALARIAFGVLSDPSKAPEYGGLHKGLNLYRLDPSDFYNEMLSQQEALILKQTQVAASSSSSSFLSQCGGERGELEREYAFTLGAFTNEHLLQSPSAAKSAYRLMYTDFISESHLAALIAFLEKGGALSDINMSDVDHFNELMKGELSKFKNPKMGLRRFNAAHLHMFVRQYDDWDKYGTDVLIRSTFVD